VTVSDQLESFRASKEVELTKQLSIYLDKLFLEGFVLKKRIPMVPKNVHCPQSIFKAWLCTILYVPP